MISAKDNPFGASRIRAIGYISQIPPEPHLVNRLKKLNYTAAIVGPHGSGKSTLLRHLEKQVSQNGIETKTLFLNLDTRLPWQTIKNCLDSISVKGVLFFDGANHLPFLKFKQLRYAIRKRNIGLVMTSHRAGPLPTLVHCQTQPALLIDLVNRLLKNNDVFNETNLTDLFQTHRGNIRDCLWQLYDEYAIKADSEVQHSADGEQNNRPVGAGRIDCHRRRDRHRESPASQNPCRL